MRVRGCRGSGGNGGSGGHEDTAPVKMLGRLLRQRGWKKDAATARGEWRAMAENPSDR